MRRRIEAQLGQLAHDEGDLPQFAPSFFEVIWLDLSCWCGHNLLHRDRGYLRGAFFR